ncbi:ABC transporter [Bathymodiolus thermophilus thioautotrophic gill symbiont]|uniref:ABC transporter n=1 Tax=Bathymodiolus thermophilus thioautotrophic gill symbiont TaxID=2360 RepID=A0A3G3IP12_9GAMM|nr:ABC transporter [Bathymodiolus thermophilus thioautotrophic gill symbiont]
MKFLMLMLTPFSLWANDIDPWEEVNRVTFEFNQTLDENIFEPIAKSYQENIPETIQNRVSDFSSNIGDINTFSNELAQFEIMSSVNTLSRILINSTAGLLGIFDIASELGLKKTYEDFGQTLAVWGMPEGDYVVLPILGPSTLRDTTGVIVDSLQSMEQTKSLDIIETTSLSAAQAVDMRVKLLPISNLLKKSDDPYIVMRSSYLQKRQFDIHNGNVPDDDEF